MPKKRPRTTVNPDAVKREVRKMVDSYDPRPQNPKAPSSVSRQGALEQEMGSRKYREMIHDHNKKNEHILDKLPFTFPKKRKIRSNRNVALICPECESVLMGSEFTIGVICPKCVKYVKPYNPEFLGRQESELAKSDKKKCQ